MRVVIEVVLLQKVVLVVVVVVDVVIVVVQVVVLQKVVVLVVIAVRNQSGSKECKECHLHTWTHRTYWLLIEKDKYWRERERQTESSSSNCISRYWRRRSSSSCKE